MAILGGYFLEFALIDKITDLVHISARVGHRKRPFAATKFGWTRPVISGGATTDLKDLLVLPSDHRAKRR